MRIGGFRGVAIGVAALVVMAGACGSDDGSTGSTGSGGSATGTGSGTSTGSPPTCEGTIPANGDACSPPGYQCVFPGSPCGGTATCEGGTWSVQTTCPPGDECPEQPPSEGEPCALNNPIVPLECSYPCSGSSIDSLVATCNDLEWVVAACPGGSGVGGAGTGGAGGSGTGGAGGSGTGGAGGG